MLGGSVDVLNNFLAKEVLNLQDLLEELSFLYPLKPHKEHPVRLQRNEERKSVR